MNEVTFSYSCFADTLEQQANKQGYTLGKQAEFLEKLVKAFNLCRIQLCNDSQSQMMNKKLHKKVISNLSLLNVQDIVINHS